MGGDKARSIRHEGVLVIDGAGLTDRTELTWLDLGERGGLFFLSFMLRMA